MNPFTNLRILPPMLAGVLLSMQAEGATRIKQDNTNSLNLASSWDALPGASDVAQWDATVTGANSTVLGGNLSWQGMAITTPGGAVTIGGANTLTLGTAGLNVGASQNFTYNSSGTIALNGPLAGSTQITLNNNTTKNWSGSGAINFTGTLVLRGGTGASGSFSGNWLALGNATLSQTGSFALDTGASLTDRGEYIVTDGWGDGTSKPKLALASLTGYGDFRSDWGANTFRTVLVNQSGATTFNGRLVSNSGSRGIDLEKDGVGTLTLAGSNTHRVTTVTGGKLVIATQLGIGTASVSVGAGANLEFNGSGLFDYKTNARMRTVSGAGTITLDGGVKVFNYTGSGTGYSEANSWNNFTGNLVIKGGSEFQTIRNGATAMGTGTVVLGDATTSGKLSQIEGNWTWTNPIQLVGSANQITNNATGSGRWNKLQGALTGGGNVTLNDSTGALDNSNLGFIIAANGSMTGILTVDTYVRVGGNTTASDITAGTLGDLGAASVVLNSGRLLTFSRSDALSVANNFSGAGSLRIGSSGITGSSTQTITLTGTNTHSGGTSVEAGRLRLGGTGVLGTGTLTLAGGVLSSNGAAARTVANTVAISLNSGVGDAVDNGTITIGTLGLAGANNSVRTLTVNSPLLLNGTVTSVSAGTGLGKAGTATLTLTGSGDWTGNTSVSAGTLLVSGSGSINESGQVTVSAGTFSINTSGQVRATSVAADTSGVINLQAGTLRTNGMSFSTGGTFNWSGGSLTPRNVGQSGLSEGAVDRNTPGSSLSAERVREGTILDISGGGLTTVAGSVLDLDSTFKSGTMRYNQVTLSGTLDLSAANDTLNFGFNPYFFRPSGYGPDAAGTLILVDAAPGGFNGGVFNFFTGVGSDQIGFSAAPGSGGVVGALGVSTLNPLTDIPVNTYYLEYETDTGNVLFHYRLSASIPEPGSAGLCLAGAVLLRALKRKYKG